MGDKVFRRRLRRDRARVRLKFGDGLMMSSPSLSGPNDTRLSERLNQRRGGTQSTPYPCKAIDFHANAAVRLPKAMRSGEQDLLHNPLPLPSRCLVRISEPRAGVEACCGSRSRRCTEIEIGEPSRLPASRTAFHSVTSKRSYKTLLQTLPVLSVQGNPILSCSSSAF